MSNLPASYDDDMSRGADPGIDELPANLLEILGCLSNEQMTASAVKTWFGARGGGEGGRTITREMDRLINLGLISCNRDVATVAVPIVYRITREGMALVASMSVPEDGAYCVYSPKHKAERRPATVIISVSLALGLLPACQQCADFTEQMSAR